MVEIPVSSFLAKLDAWTIYDAEKILTDLNRETVCGVIDLGMEEDEDGSFRAFEINYAHRNTHPPQIIYPHSAATIERMIENRGLGGDFDPKDAEWFIAGYSLSNHLAMLMAGRISTKMGRGSSFRENISIIKETESD